MISVSINLAPETEARILQIGERLLKSFDGLSIALEKLAAGTSEPQTMSLSRVPMTELELRGALKDAGLAASEPPPETFQPDPPARPKPEPVVRREPTAPRPPEPNRYPVATLPPLPMRKWTPERVEMLINLRSTGMFWHPIMDALNELPGEKILSPGAVTTKWHELKNKGKIFKAQMPPAPATSGPIPPPPPAPPALPDNKIPPPPPAAAGIEKPVAMPGRQHPGAVKLNPPSNEPPPNEWSDKRREQLRLRWERGDLVPEIRAHLNSLLGPVLSERTIITKAAAMGLNRPPPDAPYQATISEIKDWFRQNGGRPEKVSTDKRLVTAANDLRRVLKLKPFAVVA